MKIKMNLKKRKILKKMTAAQTSVRVKILKRQPQRTHQVKKRARKAPVRTQAQKIQKMKRNLQRNPQRKEIKHQARRTQRIVGHIKYLFC